MDMLRLIVAVALSYLSGSLPFGYWWGKQVMGPNFDIRNYGSYSIGFTNFIRTLGLQAAIPVLLFDVAKGYFPTLSGMYAGSVLLGWFCLVAVMLGHAKSLYFRIKEGHFSGGKSVASAFGGILALQPGIAGLSLLLFLLVLVTIRFMSVASMLGALCALGLSFYFHLGVGWNIFFATVAGLILFFHRRNISRLLHGTEPRLFEWTSIRWLWKEYPDAERPEIVDAFVIHPMGWSDLRQSILSWCLSWFGSFELTKPLGMWILSLMPVIENAEIRGIEVRDGSGRRVRILILAIPFLPGMIKSVRLANDVDKGKVTIGEGLEHVKLRKEYWRSKWLRDRLWQRLQSTTVQARRRGATVLGLGALLSTEFNGGSELQRWCDERGLGLTIDNGAAYTAVATVQAIEKESEVPLDQAKVTVVGASGFVGRITTNYLEMVAHYVTAIGRDEAKLTGFARTTAISTALEHAYDSDVVVLATSSPHTVVTPDNCGNFKTGASFMDVGRPVNVDARILTTHSEKNFKLVRCGVIRFPGARILCGVDFHFDGYFPACVVQSVMVALGGEEGIAHASRGARVRDEDFEYFAHMAKVYGFEVVSSQTS